MFNVYTYKMIGTPKRVPKTIYSWYYHTGARQTFSADLPFMTHARFSHPYSVPSLSTMTEKAAELERTRQKLARTPEHARDGSAGHGGRASDKMGGSDSHSVYGTCYAIQ